MSLLERAFMVIGVFAVEYVIVKFFTDLFEKGGK